MKEINYNEMSIKDYITLGRNDSLYYYSDRSEEIIKDLLPLVSKKTIISILISYYKGCNIGKLERTIRQYLPLVYYSEETASLVINKDGKRVEVFSSEFISSNNEESIAKARKLLMRQKND